MKELLPWPAQQHAGTRYGVWDVRIDTVYNERVLVHEPMGVGWRTRADLRNVHLLQAEDRHLVG